MKLTLETPSQACRSEIDDFRDRHRGRRCFIVGNGPSLARTDLSKLQGELFFATNRAYLAYNQGLPHIPYYCLSDPNVFAQHREEIVQADVGARFYRETAITPEVPGIRVPFHENIYMYEGAFLWDVSKGTARGHTVALDLCVPLAFYMGFTQVYLIGCDYSWKESVHFYRCETDQKVDVADLPVQRMFKSFEVARRTFEEAGRELINATQGGELEVLPRVDYDQLF